MNDTSTPEQHSVFCPSCAARVPLPDQPVDRIQCLNCGTEFSPNATSSGKEPVGESAVLIPEPTRRASTEEALLKRFVEEPPAHKPIPWTVFGVIVVAILALSYGIFRFTSKPDTYAPPTGVDTAEMVKRHLMFQPAIDSFRAVLKANPNDTSAHLGLADVAYDAGDWSESVSEFQTYLRMKPRDADARVDYAYAIAQSSGDLHRALNQIDSALLFNPNHLNALINAGILTTQTISDSNHAETLARARKYFQRAKELASKDNPAMAMRIDTLLSEIDKTGQRMAK
ncbi:MAG: tetratricopeptide repeat protein [Bacteroidota bacterium]|nr:tetratricopeptide repeat protein [Bacteroidota bacterium]MDP4234722.1 tetratricopeptide repeat protein [Bacteroidota bacterium]MDP4243945.1 tetratricopeptide repeat protein [Bacteroidota bacterium]MDP4288832.1 tetratricopeptide repeat protein [Bacteroidota bacterium]